MWCMNYISIVKCFNMLLWNVIMVPVCYVLLLTCYIVFGLNNHLWFVFQIMLLNW